MKTNEKNIDSSKDIISDYSELRDDHILKIIKRGGILTGSLGCGKSELSKYIIKRINQYFIDHQEDFNYDAKIRIFDLIHNWRFNFSSEASYCFVDERTRKLTLSPDLLIFDMELDDVEDRINLMHKVIGREFKNNRLEILKIKRKELLPTRFYVIEESNVIFTGSSIKKGFWQDFVSVARNFNLTGMYIMQRLADSSTKITERYANYIFGQTRGGNDLRKIKGMMSKEEWKEFSPNKLEAHEFIIIIDQEVFKFRIPKNEVNKDFNIFEGKEAKEYDWNKNMEIK